MSHLAPRESPTANLAYLTPDAPGIGGQIKQRPADFFVEEQPLYEPCGEGEHVYLFIEKVNLTTPDAIRRIAKAFRVSRTDIGYAGMKDKKAVTRQFVSIYMPHADEDAIQDGITRSQHHPNIKVLGSSRHGNKLRLGHLRANRFIIYIRFVDPSSVVRAKTILDTLAKRGVPNYFGDQRFGYRGNSHLIGRSILRGDARGALDMLLGMPDNQEAELRRKGREAYEAGDYTTALEYCPKKLRYERQALDSLRQGKSYDEALNAIDRAQRELILSAWQSALFNRVLTSRMVEGTFDKLIAGDLAMKHGNRAVFSVDEATADLENAPGGRIEQMQISPSGPMWGSEMIRATGQVDELECRALEDDGFAPDEIKPPSRLNLRGQRRPLRVPLTNPDVSSGVDEHASYVRVAFDLPRGSFATIALREIMKKDYDAD